MSLRVATRITTTLHFLHTKQVDQPPALPCHLLLLGDIPPAALLWRFLYSPLSHQVSHALPLCSQLFGHLCPNPTHSIPLLFPLYPREKFCPLMSRTHPMFDRNQQSPPVTMLLKTSGWASSLAWVGQQTQPYPSRLMQSQCKGGRRKGHTNAASPLYPSWLPIWSTLPMLPHIVPAAGF